jgi:preprotein translocase subunit SecE
MANKDEERDDAVTEDDEESFEETDESAEERDEDASEEESDDFEEEEESEDTPEAHERIRKAVVRDDIAQEALALATGEIESLQPAQIGSTRYVHAAFFTAGILIAYLSSKILVTTWGALADWPTATRAVPLLLRFAEDERGTYTLAAGALIGVISVIQTYRNESIRRWADEVAIELSKVTWPDKDTVTNGTVVVIIASVIATVYVALLDRFWGFLTHLVYGA